MRMFIILLVTMGITLAETQRFPEIALKTGVLKNALIVVENPDRIKVTHADGIRILKFEDLPSELLEPLGLTKEKFEAFRAKEAEKVAKEAKAEQEAKEAEAEAMIKAEALRVKEAENAAEEAKAERKAQAAEADAMIKMMSKTIREVETDQLRFARDQEDFIIHGVVEVSSYYNFGYDKAQASHYAFEIKDATGTAHAYMRVDRAQELREQLINAGGPMEGSFTMRILPGRFDPNAGDIMAELLVASSRLDGSDEKEGTALQIRVLNTNSDGVIGGIYEKTIDGWLHTGVNALVTGFPGMENLAQGDTVRGIMVRDGAYQMTMDRTEGLPKIPKYRYLGPLE